MSQDIPPSPDKEPSTGKPQPVRQTSVLGKFWQELKRRHVVRVAMVYAVVGWLVIQIAVSTFPSLYIPAWALSLVIMCVLLGFPVSLIIAWAFELTPEGVKTTKVAQKQKEDSPHATEFTRKRKWISYGIGAAVPTFIFGILALFFYIRSSGGLDFTNKDRSIAVLPFDNRSNIVEDQFFTDGIHDDLLTEISQIREIKTISRTSVMTYRGSNKTLKEIAEELGVTVILEGGVQRSGDRIRINVQLIEAASDANLWAENYTRRLTLENVFEIQNEITRTIANALKVVLSPEDEKRIEKLPTQSLEALEAYFRALERFEASATKSAEAVSYLRQAIEFDPNFAVAHARLGWMLIRQSWLSGLPSEQQLSLAEPYIIKALELDPMLSEAYVSLGMLKRGRDDIQGSESAYKRAIELNPNNADAYERYGWLLRDYVDDNKGAAKLLRKAYELDPKSEVALNRLSQSYETLGKWSEALEVKRAWVEQQPENSLPFNQLGKLLEGGLGQFDEAIIAYRKAYALDSISPIIPNGIGDSYLSLGDIEKAVWWYERSINLYKDPQRKAFYQTWIYNITGNTEAARRESLKALEVRGAYTSGYLKIVSRINLAAGDTGDSIAQYKETYPELFSSNATVDTNNYWNAADLARLLVASGESEQTDKLISGALEAVSSEPPWLGNRTIKISLHAIAGDHANALNALSSFIDDGGSPYSDTFRDDLKILAGNAEFEALLEKGKARMAKQLKRIREMEANGELAPIPDLPAN